MGNCGYLKFVFGKIMFALGLLYSQRKKCNVNIYADTYPYHMMLPYDVWELEYFTPVKRIIVGRYRHLKLK
jgi:hypothetical protein